MKQTAKIEPDLQIIIIFDYATAAKTMGCSIC